jgi:hypothetical protein
VSTVPNILDTERRKNTTSSLHVKTLCVNIEDDIKNFRYNSKANRNFCPERFDESGNWRKDSLDETGIAKEWQSVKFVPFFVSSFTKIILELLSLLCWGKGCRMDGQENVLKHDSSSLLFTLSIHVFFMLFPGLELTHRLDISRTEYMVVHSPGRRLYSFFHGWCTSRRKQDELF